MIALARRIVRALFVALDRMLEPLWSWAFEVPKFTPEQLDAVRGALAPAAPARSPVISVELCACCGAVLREAVERRGTCRRCGHFVASYLCVGCADHGGWPMRNRFGGPPCLCALAYVTREGWA